MNEKEIRKLQWWHDHHRDNAIYLITHIEAVLAGQEHSKAILEAALIGYRQLYLPEETRVSESETETKTTE